MSYNLDVLISLCFFEHSTSDIAVVKKYETHLRTVLLKAFDIDLEALLSSPSTKA
jgi:hypothetical protein